MDRSYVDSLQYRQEVCSEFGDEEVTTPLLMNLYWQTLRP